MKNGDGHLLARVGLSRTMYFCLISCVDYAEPCISAISDACNFIIFSRYDVVLSLEQGYGQGMRWG